MYIGAQQADRLLGRNQYSTISNSGGHSKGCINDRQPHSWGKLEEEEEKLKINTQDDIKREISRDGNTCYTLD